MSRKGADFRSNEYQSYLKDRDIQRDNIIANLRLGTMTIKADHITNLNPCAEERTLPMSEKQIVARLNNLSILGGDVGDISKYPEHVQEVIKKQRGYRFSF